MQIKQNPIHIDSILNMKTNVVHFFRFGCCNPYFIKLHFASILGESEKTWGVLGDCDTAFSDSSIVNYIFPCSQESNLDHKPFPIVIGHFMHLKKNIFFLRPCLGVLQTGEIFDQVFSAFSVKSSTY